MKEIPLTQGYVALVDDADFEAVNKFKWCAHKVGRNVYAAHNFRSPEGTWFTLHLHNFLFPEAKHIDHRDGNGCNNQRHNLRLCRTQRENLQGFQKKKLNTSSRYRGVCWGTKVGKWLAHITVNGRLLYIGSFRNEIVAAKARDKKALEFFGKEAGLNFPSKRRGKTTK